MVYARLLGGRSTVGLRALDADIGVRIPASQPDFARLRRASSGPASPALSPASLRQAKSVPPKRAQAAKADPSGSRFPHCAISPGFAERATSIARIPESLAFSFTWPRGLSCHAYGMEPRRFVYILRCDTHPDRHYVGLTSDVPRRLHWHNNGPSGVTVHHRPWSLAVSLEFTDARTAGRFERYLKTGSGRAFGKRHF